MDNVAVKEEVKEGQVMYGIFPLAHQPMDLQITIHVNNLLYTYGNDATKEFKRLLTNPEEIDDSQLGALVIRQIIRYYGVNKIRAWFKMIYGWTYEKAG